MCGILCEVSCSGYLISKDEQILNRVKNRGPNGLKCVAVKNHFDIMFCGAVLWMQGPAVVTQPIENEKGILLYNGDIFDKEWDLTKSDTEQIMERLSNTANGSTVELIEQLENLRGPYSIIYYSKLTKDLIFTRDKIGRNSLVFHQNQKSIVISSVLGRKYECFEIPASHIHVLNLVSKKIKLYTRDNTDTIDFGLQEWINSVMLLQNQPDEQYSIDCEIPLNLDMEQDIINYVEHTSLRSCKMKIMEMLLNNELIKHTVMEIIRLLETSVELRLITQPNKCKNCLHSSETCDHSAVGILFSGGLDCTILAFLADKYVPKEQSIDLLNVAFKKDDNSSYDVPDRITGKQSVKELRDLCPHRKWVFREINIPKERLNKCQETVIGDLIFPRQTILDESLGSALWFAAQGQDDFSVSPCRVLLLGSGADELFGGYTRHRNAFKRQGWAGLGRELLLDWKRISFRNLARDNRVICDHGRQPRMPYLDDDFANYVINLKPWFKCFPCDTLGPGIGDKLYLRLAAFHLKLKKAAVLPKRALQFGSRIANKKEKGNDISKTLKLIKNN